MFFARLSGLGSRSELSTWSFGFLFDTLLREYSGLYQDFLIWSAYFASEAMGVGFYSYVQYTTMWDLDLSEQLINSYFLHMRVWILHIIMINHQVSTI